MKRPEILAPAGSMETLIAALRSGADAVYAGGRRFSARNSAVNFSDEELSEALRMCHLYGAKLYLAVNTIISDGEASDFCSYIRKTSFMGIDGYIVQDWGAAELIRRTVPDAVIHASTQMSVHTAAGAALLKELGYVRVVPARELDKDTLRRICAEDIEVEVFVHGALCMSVSGQCYMSAMMGSRSANRGCCGQACRLPFSAVGNRNASALSLKDLSLLTRTDELKDIGIDSLKIEGRMKRPEYVASAVHELNKALNGEMPDMQTLKGIFSRSGFTDGYFTGIRKNMFGVREKDDVTAAQSLIPKIHELYRSERSVYDVELHLSLHSGKPAELTAVCGGISVSVSGDTPDTAVNRPTDKTAAEKQLSKMGDTVFNFAGLSANIDDNLFVPAGKLNELRRRVTDKLSQAVTEKNTPEYHITDYSSAVKEYNMPDRSGKLPLRTFCRTAEQVYAAAGLSQFVIVPLDIIPEVLRNGIAPEKVIAYPPRFITDEEKLSSQLAELKNSGVSRLLCHTPDTIAFGRKTDMTLHGSFTLNVFNSFSADYLKSIGLEDCIVSFEAKTQQIRQMFTGLPLGAVVYGRLPLMLTRNCPIRNEVGCDKCTGKLTDRTGREMPVACSKEYVEILNQDILFAPEEFGFLSFGAVWLSDEDTHRTVEAVSGVKPEHPTWGLYHRGLQEVL